MILKQIIDKLGGNNYGIWNYYCCGSPCRRSYLVWYAFGANAFEALGMVVNPMIGVFLTGIVISRGSNYASDLLHRIANPSVG